MDKITVWFIVGFVVLVTVVVVAAGVMSGGFSTANNASSTFVATTVSGLTPADWMKGNANAKVSLIEYGDYECPACDEYEPILEQVVRDYGDRVVFAYRNFPLYTIHRDAGISAQAAEAAGLQGKFWEMHDLLYAKQSEWITAAPGDVVKKYFDGYAASLGINVEKFDRDISASVVTGKIAADVASGNAASVDHTPTFFVNLEQIPNPSTYNELKAVLDETLASSTAP